MRCRLKGVTLVELMIVVVIIAILAAIAVPSYSRYVIRSQRSDATTALLRLQSAQEKVLLQSGAYTTNLTSKPTDSPPGLGIGTVSEQGFYSLSATLTATGYTATASVIAGKAQAQDTTCRSFTVTETGARGAVDGSGVDRTAECWR